MNLRALLPGVSVLSLSLIAAISHAEYCGNNPHHCSAGFDNQSIKGCYVFSYYGNFLGPEIAMNSEAQQQSGAPASLVSYGYSTVGRLCFDGAGNAEDVSGTANFAGLCVDTYSGTGKYQVQKDGTGGGSVNITIDTVTDGCASLGVEQGINQSYTFSTVLQSKRDCIKTILTSAATVGPDGSIPQPIVAEGEACRQVIPR